MYEEMHPKKGPPAAQLFSPLLAQSDALDDAMQWRSQFGTTFTTPPAFDATVDTRIESRKLLMYPHRSCRLIRHELTAPLQRPLCKPQLETLTDVGWSRSPKEPGDMPTAEQEIIESMFR